MTETRKRGPRGGICSYCGLPSSGLKYHERYCLKRDWNAELERMNRFQARAAAHSLAAPRPMQQWAWKITDTDVAHVLYAIEAEDAEFYRNSRRRWFAPATHALRFGHNLSTVISEMIRTGLVRHVVEYGVDYLVPALVHLRDGQWSACRFTGEDLGPMRARLVDDLTLVDCLECEVAIAQGHPRGL